MYINHTMQIIIEHTSKWGQLSNTDKMTYPKASSFHNLSLLWSSRWSHDHSEDICSSNNDNKYGFWGLLPVRHKATFYILYHLILPSGGTATILTVIPSFFLILLNFILINNPDMQMMTVQTAKSKTGSLYSRLTTHIKHSALLTHKSHQKILIKSLVLSTMFYFIHFILMEVQHNSRRLETS